MAALQTIYGQADGRIRPIEPDLLGEHAVMAALKDDADRLLEVTLQAALVEGEELSGGAAAILTALGRATRAEHDPETRETAWDAIRGVEQFVADLPPDGARRLDDALPRYATPLLRLSAIVARRVADVSGDQAEQARSLDWLSIRLSETGDRAGALAPAQRAVAIYETLAAENPAAYLPDLARSLHNLGNRLSETGDRAGALAPARRAVAIYETLAADSPAAYLPDFASSLHNLGILLSETGDRAGALAPVRRAVAIRETLAADNPAAHLPDFASSLNNLGHFLDEAGDADAAAITARLAEVQTVIATADRRLG